MAIAPVITAFIDALGVVQALTPLAMGALGGQKVTDDEVRAALAGKDAALKRFDEIIAQKS